MKLRPRLNDAGDTQILLHALHHVAHIGRHVRDVAAAFGRDDDPEMMPIRHPRCRLLLGIQALFRGVIEHARLAIGAGAIAAQVAGVARQTALGFAGLVPRYVCLDDHTLQSSTAGRLRANAPGLAPEAAQSPGELRANTEFAALRVHLPNAVRVNLSRGVSCRISCHTVLLSPLDATQSRQRFVIPAVVLSAL